MSRPRVRIGLLVAGLAVAFASPARAIAPAPVDPIAAVPDTLDGTGPSYWGAVPAAADSNTASFDGPDRAAWEYPVDALWYTVRFPVALFRAGARETIVWLDESGTYDAIKRLLSPIDLPYGFTLGGSRSRLNGITGNIGVFHNDFLGTDNRFRLTGSFSTRGDRRISGGVVIPSTPGSFLEVGGGYRLRTRARYFGLGPFSQEANEAYLTREATWVGSNYRQAIGGAGFAVEGGVLYSVMSSRAPEGEDYDEEDEDFDDEMSIPMVFPDAIPRGYQDASGGFDFMLSLIRDTTHEAGRPRAGGVQRLKAGYFWPDESDDNDFVMYRAETQHFFDLWWDRSLALRGVYAWIDSDGEPVHFQRLLVNDDPDLFRGYEDFRFRDRGLTLFSAEYRWPVWDYQDPGEITVDAYGFYDTGQVFRSNDQIALAALADSYGFGFRLATQGGFVGRLEVGFSEEDWVLRIRGDQTFQFDAQGLYHGREPIPVR